MIEATKIYARFASEVYDDFGEVGYEQEYYRKEHADEELRATKHALWMARALRASAEKQHYGVLAGFLSFNKEAHRNTLRKAFVWEKVERKCLEKAKEFE